MRTLVILISAISLLISVSAGALWWRSWRHAPADEDRHSWQISTGERYTIRSDAGRIALFAPPPGNLSAPAMFGMRKQGDANEYWVSATRPTQQAWELARPPARPGVDPPLDQVVGGLRNDQFSWCTLVRRDEAGPPRVDAIYCMGLVRDAPGNRLVPGTVAMEIDSHSHRFTEPPPFAEADRIAGLLVALEDPQRFAMAHALLSQLPRGARLAVSPQADGSAVALYQGLRLVVRPPTVPAAGRARSGYTRSAPVEIDPDQLPAIRDQWHRTLDVEVAAVPHWAIVGGTAILPLLCVCSLIRRSAAWRTRRREGLCMNCGFDLRATPERCPECGVEAKRAVTSTGSVAEA